MIDAWQGARDLASLADDASLFAGSAGKKLERLLAALRSLAERYDVMVANPPYMGSNNMNIWLNGWTKKNYAETCKDLCTCFIKRGMILAAHGGYEALITSDTCMYISSFKKLRKMLIDEMCIIAFIDTRGTNAHPDVFDANAGWVLWNSKDACAKGAYFKLNQPIAEKEARYLEALANPDCGWFYRQNVDSFSVVPNTPILYWASSGVFEAFRNFPRFGKVADARVGLITGDVNRFLKHWHEVSLHAIDFECTPGEKNKSKWVPCTKGGEYRLWYGNTDYVMNWENDGWEMKNDNFDGDRVRAHNFNGDQAFKEGVSWSTISSSLFHCRYVPKGFMFDTAGPFCEIVRNEVLWYSLGLMSSSVYRCLMQYLNPTMNFPPGYLQMVPYCFDEEFANQVEVIVKSNVKSSKDDWDSLETSWDYKRCPIA